MSDAAADGKTLREQALRAAVARAEEERKALLISLRTASERTVATVLPVLLHRARGRAREEVLEAIPSLYHARKPGVVECYALLGVLRRVREPAVLRSLTHVLLLADEVLVQQCVLALQLSSKVTALRDAHDTQPVLQRLERATETVFTWDDALAQRLREGRASGSECLAALLATAGGERASGTLLRRWLFRSIDAGVALEPSLVRLLHWLALEAVGQEEVPRWAADPDWWNLCALSLARAALEKAGPSAALQSAFASVESGSFSLLLAETLVRRVVLAAEGGDTAALEALRVGALELSSRVAERSLTSLICEFLRVKILDERARGALVGAALVSDEVRVVEAALANCEALGVLAAALPALRLVAAKHVLASARERAKALLRVL